MKTEDLKRLAEVAGYEVHKTYISMDGIPMCTSNWQPHEKIEQAEEVLTSWIDKGKSRTCRIIQSNKGAMVSLYDDPNKCSKVKSENKSTAICQAVLKALGGGE